MLWCTAPVLSSMAQHLFYLLATNLLPHLPSCSALSNSSTHFPLSHFLPSVLLISALLGDNGQTVRYHSHTHTLFPYLCLFSFPHFTQFPISPFSLCLPACLSICPSFQQPHLSRCPSFHPITASAPASQPLSASGYLSRARHTHLLSSSITSTAVHSHF